MSLVGTMTVLLTVKGLEWPQKVQITNTLTQESIQLRLIYT